MAESAMDGSFEILQVARLPPRGLVSDHPGPSRVVMMMVSVMAMSGVAAALRARFLHAPTARDLRLVGALLIALVRDA